jgi:anti-sigma B factor antagonist
MALADLDIRTVGQGLVARLSGEIDLSNAGDLRAAIGRELTNQPLGLVLDLRAVDYLDSAGIQVVYDLRERLRERGQRLALVVGNDSPIAETLRIVDLPNVVAIAGTVDDALRLVED